MNDLQQRCEKPGSFEALTIYRSGAFEIDVAPDKALPLFTAPGEKSWVPDWNPTILSGNGFEKGTVFVTGQQGARTYWLVIDYDTATRHALYVRTTPEVDTGTVDISVGSDHGGGTTIHVTYSLTALSEAGNTRLRETFNPSAYAKMMEGWRTLIAENRTRIAEQSPD
ncbi:SRPBCC family protein [Martelella sp. HB161492]|uniref:SRPBCC family protein n=1 Tax=Martelella sp. HB161492 TaxID=2720726 RepID=UPI00158FA2E8|nr:SRPBCC family protein [Martelella sp. HB161492]